MAKCSNKVVSKVYYDAEYYMQKYFPILDMFKKLH